MLNNNSQVKTANYNENRHTTWRNMHCCMLLIYRN